jgi:hypothetical protein
MQFRAHYSLPFASRTVAIPLVFAIGELSSAGCSNRSGHSHIFSRGELRGDAFSPQDDVALLIPTAALLAPVEPDFVAGNHPSFECGDLALDPLLDSSPRFLGQCVRFNRRKVLLTYFFGRNVANEITPENTELARRAFADCKPNGSAAYEQTQCGEADHDGCSHQAECGD